MRPMRPCGQPGCPTLVESGMCPEHTRQTRTKSPEQQRFYGSQRWKKLRRLVRAQEPICRECKREPSTNVDHISGQWEDNRRENLRALCSPCNATITAKQHREKRG